MDILNNKEVVHTKGALWRCVRASMTLAGFLPPIWEGDRLLVDGGYLNVLPADVMNRLGAATIIAVDVAPQESTETYYPLSEKPIPIHPEEKSAWTAIVSLST